MEAPRLLRRPRALLAHSGRRSPWRRHWSDVAFAPARLSHAPAFDFRETLRLIVDAVRTGLPSAGLHPCAKRASSRRSLARSRQCRRGRAAARRGGRLPIPRPVSEGGRRKARSMPPSHCPRASGPRRRIDRAPTVSCAGRCADRGPRASGSTQGRTVRYQRRPRTVRRAGSLRRMKTRSCWGPPPRA